MEPVVHVVDDDPSLLKSLCWLLESVGLTVALFESAQNFLAEFDPAQPGCVLLDVRMPGMNGLELHQDFKSRNISIPIIVFTGHGDVAMAVQAMKDGAFDVIEKPYNEQGLLDRINDAIEYDRRIRRESAKRDEAIARIALLTPREREVMDLIVEGLANKQMAARLGISEKTVEVHRSRGKMKLRADSVAELVKIALRAQPHQNDIQYD
ncbi:MAG: response regulator transcription factor [Planctomycetes bacterium]|nr:response regulator transcription factor [Planctomycetota bacterium]